MWERNDCAGVNDGLLLPLLLPLVVVVVVVDHSIPRGTSVSPIAAEFLVLDRDRELASFRGGSTSCTGTLFSSSSIKFRPLSLARSFAEEMKAVLFVPDASMFDTDGASFGAQSAPRLFTPFTFIFIFIPALKLEPDERARAWW